MKPEYVFYVNVGRRSFQDAKRHLNEIRDDMDRIFGEGRVLVLERRGDSVIKVLNPNKSNRPWTLFCELLGESGILSRKEPKPGDAEVKQLADMAFIATELFEQIEEIRAKEMVLKEVAEDAAAQVDEAEKEAS